jgi:hypothetical protein
MSSALVGYIFEMPLYRPGKIAIVVLLTLADPSQWVTRFSLYRVRLSVAHLSHCTERQSLCVDRAASQGNHVHLQRALKLPVLLQVLLNHLLDGIGAWAKGVPGGATETLLNEVIKSVFLMYQPRFLITYPITYGTLDTCLDDDEVGSCD